MSAFPRCTAPRRVDDSACDACGCWVVFDFQCNCGEVHKPVCDNCNRFRGLDPKVFSPDTSDRALAMAGARRCTRGPVPHRHEPDMKLMHETMDACFADAKMPTVRT